MIFRAINLMNLEELACNLLWHNVTIMTLHYNGVIILNVDADYFY